MTDPARERLAPLAARPAPEFVRAALATGLLGDALAAHDAFAARVADLLTVLLHHGVHTATATATALTEATPHTRESGIPPGRVADSARASRGSQHPESGVSAHRAAT
jgi:hypothetical protein